MAEYRDKLVNEILNKPLEIGDIVYVPLGIYNKSTRNPERKVKSIIVAQLSDNIYKIKCDDNEHVYVYGYNEKEFYKNVHLNDITINTDNIGVNPFKNIDFWGKIERVNYDLENILLILNIFPKDEEYKKQKYEIGGVVVNEYNDNPFIFDKNGHKKFYQRDYVWSLEDEQSFIESIYNGLDCGKIVIRQRSWKWIEDMVAKGDYENIAFNDIVDGKQRINTLKRFLNDEFCDSNGFYYSDLSKQSKRYFMRSMNITFLRLGEKAKDEDVIKTFLMVNFSGKSCSKEHLEYIKSINI